MVALSAFPVAKLGGLLLRQVSKPIANFAKERAKKSPIFRSYVCMPPAQLHNWCEVRLKMYFMNQGFAGKVTPLSETLAIELGSNLLGEGIIFAIAAVLLILEYNRQARKEQVKEKERLQEKEDLINSIRDLDLMSEQHSAELKRLTYLVDDLISKINIKSYSGSTTPSETPLRLNKASLTISSEHIKPDLTKNLVSNEMNENIIFKRIKMLIQSI